MERSNALFAFYFAELKDFMYFCSQKQTSYMRRLAIVVIVCFLMMGFAFGQSPCGPVPTENQLRWQDMEMYAFIHYSMNTYTDQEWGFGNEDPKLFNPSDLDCRQWARVCKQAGMKGNLDN